MKLNDILKIFIFLGINCRTEIHLFSISWYNWLIFLNLLLIWRFFLFILLALMSIRPTFPLLVKSISSYFMRIQRPVDSLRISHINHIYKLTRFPPLIHRFEDSDGLIVFGATDCALVYFIHSRFILYKLVYHVTCILHSGIAFTFSINPWSSSTFYKMNSWLMSTRLLNIS